MAPKYISKLAREARRHRLGWQYLYNFWPTMLYRFKGQKLSEQARRVKNELDQRGVAITSVEELFGSDSCFSELLEAINATETERGEDLSAARHGSTNISAIGQKVFNVELLGTKPTFDISDIYARIALRDDVLGIANSYLGMFTSLRYYNVWHTFATDNPPRESQLWHRDREDYHVLKMFLYVSDVDENSGPFNYVPGTHPKGTQQQTPPFFLEGGVARSDDEQMAEVIPRELWKKCTGSRGTIIFADTRGYHKGGLARTHDRIMFTCMFTSPASESERLLLKPKLWPNPTELEKKYALKGAFVG